MFNIDDKTNITGSATNTDTSDNSDISRYNGHFALAGKHKGCCNQLLGNVVIVSFLVHEEKSAWKKQDIQVFEQVLKKVADILEKESGFSKNKLNIAYAFDALPVQVKFDRDDYSQIVSKVITRYGDYKSVAEYQTHYKKKFKRDEAPLVFAVHRDFRSFAKMESSASTEEYLKNSDELSFVSYSDDVDSCVKTLIHEILHQFGAIDYYVHDEVKNVANRLFPGSIMTSGLNISVDPLTRYLIGWDDTPDDVVFEFLESTKNITEDDIREAYIKDKENDW